MDKSVAQQEKEIMDVVKRADKNPDKTGAQRRDALRRLIDMTHSKHANLKILAAASIRNYFNDFPGLEDIAIDAIYDLCEDQDPSVRTAGYNAILQVSRDQRRWVKRNADVLVQLLQSDEPDEVEFVKKALAEHLDLDPQVTLGVLCDQIVPADEPMDEEEQEIRDRLRSLVIAFLTGRAKRAIVDRHISKPGNEAEQVLVGGLLTAITKLNNPAEIQTIVQDLLLSLPCYKPSSDRAHELMKVILTKASSSLKDELRGSETLSLTNTRLYLDLAAELVTGRRLVSAEELLKVYCSSLLRNMILQRLSSDAQLFIVLRVTQALATCDFGPNSNPSEQLIILRRQIVDVTPILLKVLVDVKNLNADSWTASGVLLKACADRKRDSPWVVPQNLTSQLQALQTLADSGVTPEAPKDVRDLLTALLYIPIKPTPQLPTPSDISKNIPSGSNDMLRSLPDRPPRRMNIPNRARANTDEQIPTHQSPRAVASSSSSGGLGMVTKRTSPLGDPPRSPKRARKDGAEGTDSPSLLSRMGYVTGEANKAKVTSVGGGATQTTAARVQVPSASSRPGASSGGGFSIKGAAQAERRRQNPPPLPSKPVSLLDRMKPGGDGNNRRKKERGKVNP